jgi:hypothetical protein
MESLRIEQPTRSPTLDRISVFRLREAEYEAATVAARMAGVSFSALVRSGVLHATRAILAGSVTSPDDAR